MMIYDDGEVMVMMLVMMMPVRLMVMAVRLM